MTENRVTAIIVTRGDVDLVPITHSLPKWEVVVYNNGAGEIMCYNNGSSLQRWYARAEDFDVEDLKVAGRYEAIREARSDIIYVQDDDCIVNDPKAIVEQYNIHSALVASMPADHGNYTDSCLVGWGAVFERRMPEKAFELYRDHGYSTSDELFYRTCDVVFTALTHHVKIDVGHTNMDYATDSYRMYHDSLHDYERAMVLDRCRIIRHREGWGW